MEHVTDKTPDLNTTCISKAISLVSLQGQLIVNKLVKDMNCLLYACVLLSFIVVRTLFQNLYNHIYWTSLSCSIVIYYTTPHLKMKSIK